MPLTSREGERRGGGGKVVCCVHEKGQVSKEERSTGAKEL